MSDTPAEPSSPETPRRAFRFKPREFVADNPPVSTPSAGPTDVRQHFLAAIPASSPPSVPKAVLENDVHALLRDNLAAADAAGLNDVKPVARRRSRRLRDYWVTLLGVDGFLLALWAPGVFPEIFLLSGLVLFSVGFTWVMWCVVDDY
jgi:hypothetical protein